VVDPPWGVITPPQNSGKIYIKKPEAHSGVFKEKHGHNLNNIPR
jgi:hypothetical protein